MILIKQDNPEYIKALLFKDNLYKTLIRNLNIITWIPNTKDINWYAGVKNNKVYGVFLTHKQGDYTVFHGGVYKEFRGNTVELLKECLAALPCDYSTKFITTVHKDNKLAQRIHKKSGFTEISRNNDYITYGE